MDEDQILLGMEMSVEIMKETADQDPAVAALGCVVAAAKHSRIAEDSKDDFLKLCGQAWDLSKR